MQAYADQNAIARPSVSIISCDGRFARRRFAPWARSALRAFGKWRWRKPFRDFGRVQKMRAVAQSSLEKLCARSRLEGHSALGQVAANPISALSQ